MGCFRISLLYTPLNRALRQFYPDLYTGFLYRKHFVVGNPDYGSPTWETVKGWYAGDVGARGMVHELGHNFGLSHHDCGANIMSYAAGNHNYLSKQDVSIMYQSASLSSLRQYFAENSFKNTSIISNTNQLWDLNFRLYSNVEILNNSSLKTTCKIIMAPESRIIVRSGNNFVIEGADISSANNASWNGIKIEGNGYGLILPDTKIDNGYFFMYTGNSIFPGRSSLLSEPISINNKQTIDLPSNLEDIKIFPNPTGDFINIKTNGQMESVSILDFEGKEIKNFSKHFNRIEVQSLTSGLYILSVRLKNKIVNKKFIKK